MIKREMRRKDRELSTEEAMAILQNGKFGVLSAVGDDGYPYGVPLHYVVIDDSLYFHCTIEGGYMTECLERSSRVCFTVVATEDGIKCRSAVFFGTAVAVPELREIVLERMVEKFVPAVAWAQAKSGIPRAKDGVRSYKLSIEQLTAKFVDKPAGR